MHSKHVLQGWHLQYDCNAVRHEKQQLEKVTVKRNKLEVSPSCLVECSQTPHKQALTAPAAQYQPQLRALLVATLDKGDLAAAGAGGAGDLETGAASLPAAVWSALAAAVAATAAVVRTASPTFCSAAPSGPPAATKPFKLEQWNSPSNSIENL
jgi:hypothetical protein